MLVSFFTIAYAHCTNSKQAWTKLYPCGFDNHTVSTPTLMICFLSNNYERTLRHKKSNFINWGLEIEDLWWCYGESRFRVKRVISNVLLGGYMVEMCEVGEAALTNDDDWLSDDYRRLNKVLVPDVRLVVLQMKWWCLPGWCPWWVWKKGGRDGKEERK